MKKTTLLLVMSILTLLSATAQQDIKVKKNAKNDFRRFSIDISAGIPFISGDIENKLVGYEASARFNWNITSAVSLGTEFGMGNLHGLDKDKAGDYFFNKYFKAAIGGEIYLFNVLRFNELSKWFQPYVGYDFGFIKSNIEQSGDDYGINSNHFNDWVMMQQFKAGLKFKLSNTLDLNLIGTMSQTASDLIDNYNPIVHDNRNRDAIAALKVGLTIHLGNKDNESVIWNGLGNETKVNNIEEDSLEMYTKTKMLELENKIASLERANNAVNNKLSISEQKVNGLEVKLNEFESKSLKLENEIKVSNIVGLVVYFDSSSDKIPSSEKSKLSNLVESLKGNDSKLKISGYTDKRGDAKFNLDLSVKRAQKVKDYLISIGIASERSEIKGYGENQLLPDSDRGNRRVVVEIVK